MRNIREVLRLSWSLGLSQRQVARSVEMSQSTVWDYLLRAKAAQLSWEQVEGFEDGELERRLYPTEAADSALDLGIVYTRRGKSAELKSLAQQAEEMFQHLDLPGEAAAAMLLFIQAVALEQASEEYLVTLRDAIARKRRNRDAPG